MTSLEMAMAFMLGLTVLTAVSAVAIPNDPMRLTRVLLAVGSAVVFQLHVLFEGPRSGHWPLYAAGFVVLILVAAHWFMSPKAASVEPAVEPEDEIDPSGS